MVSLLEKELFKILKEEIILAIFKEIVCMDMVFINMLMVLHMMVLFLH